MAAAYVRHSLPKCLLFVFRTPFIWRNMWSLIVGTLRFLSLLIRGSLVGMNLTVLIRGSLVGMNLTVLIRGSLVGMNLTAGQTFLF